MGDRLTQEAQRSATFLGVHSLQVWLTILVLLVLIPTLTVGVLTLLRAGQSYRDASSNQMLQTAKLVGQSVSNELRATVHILDHHLPIHGVATPSSETLFDGQFASVTIKTGDMRNRSDLRLALALKAAETGKVEISNIFFPTGEQSKPQVAIAAPRAKTNVGTDVSTFVVEPKNLVHTLIHEDAFSRTQLLAVTDGNGRILARSREAEKFIGTLAPDWKTLKAFNRPSGAFEARTIEGPMVMFAFHEIPGTPGWVAVVGEPLSAFNARWRRPIEVMLIGSSATLLAAFLLAMILGRKILRPIKSLAQNARAIADGQSGVVSVLPTESFVSEFEALRKSLDRADAATLQSHQAMQKSYEDLRQAEKLARIGSWTLDLATGHFACSDMLYELNGVDPDGPPLTIESLKDLIAPDSVGMMVRALEHCAQTGKSYAMEVTHMRPDGSTFPAVVRGEAVRNDEEEIVCITGTVQDISERIEVRERLATLADNLPSGVIYRIEETSDRDRTLNVTYVSAGIHRLIGVNAHEIVQNRANFVRRIVKEDRIPFARSLIRSRFTGEPVDKIVRVGTREGKILWMQMRSAPRCQADGITVWDGIARDITSEREAAEALREAKEAAEVAEKAKSEFLATMSHEIRTPMNTVIGMTRLTLQTSLAPKQRNYIEKIDLSAKTLLGVINDILDFSKIEAGGLELEETEFTIESLLNTVSAVTAMSAEEKGLEMIYAIASGVPHTLYGDPLRLGQVLTNLVSNAVKFTHSGEVIISIVPQMDEFGTSSLLFSVKDTGIGLSRSQISGLFQPFTQGGIDTFRKYGGTGLGLAICKKLIELMGGRIWAEGSLGEGSTFYFTLPIHPVDALETETSPFDKRNQLDNRRVLVVDDNESARLILGEMLSGFGLTVEGAQSGASAIAMLKAAAAQGTPFDIVLMDWRMPEMDGLEAARIIREDISLSQMPAVLMVTAFGREEVLHGVENLSLEGLLIKPVTASVLFNTVADILVPQSGQLRQRSRSDAHVHGAYSALRGKRVLVVDDNALNREVAGDFLDLIGVEVETANDGIEAINLLNTKAFDVVLMDVHMPRMDGLSAAREIRLQPQWASLPIIALTALARVEDQKESRAAGMNAHLTKPIEHEALYQTLAEVLNLSNKSLEDARSIRGDSENGGGLDLELALRRFGNNRARLERMLESYLKDSINAPHLFSAHLQLGDDQAAAALAHKLKGSSSYFGAKRFCEVAQAIEKAAYEGRSVAPFEGEFLRELSLILDQGQYELECLKNNKDDYYQEIGRKEVLELITKASSLIVQGDYSAGAVLEEIRKSLNGYEAYLVEKAKINFDELNLDVSISELEELRSILLSQGNGS